MTSRLTGKAALVTGASRGIGAATAIELANAGASVMLCARSEREINDLAGSIREAGGKAQAMRVDVTAFTDLEAAVERCVEIFGGLDILVNNAGVVDPISHLATSDPQRWAEAADINYKGVYFGMRAALPIIQKQGSGTIVTISSGAAHGPMEGWSHYCGAKAGAAMLTRCAHKETAGKGVRVFDLSPGTVATDMQVKIRASGINPVSQLDPSVHIDPSWPARAVVWLCSDAADEFVGQEVSLKDENMKRRIGLVA